MVRPEEQMGFSQGKAGMGQIKKLSDCSLRCPLLICLLTLMLSPGPRVGRAETPDTPAQTAALRPLPPVQIVAFEKDSQTANAPVRLATELSDNSAEDSWQGLPAEEVGPLEPIACECLSEEPSSPAVMPISQWVCEDSCWDIGAMARGYWLNDQRIEWTGLESTFGAEGSVNPSWQRTAGNWDLLAYGDFYLNQPFDQNILLDTLERRSYAANFETEVFEISNLYLSATYDAWTFSLGKFESPFGRYYFPLLSNPRFDAPFIRTEAINWRETGMLIHREGDLFVADVALTNGSVDKDTNSSKALVARVGLQGENFAAGCSIKTQDGIGSEWQKYYENHVGADAMVKFGNWTLSGEVIYDEYGFRRPGFRQVNITWGRSIYNRDLYNPNGKPLTSVGYYADLGYQGERWYFGFNYGQNQPVAIGDDLHDQVISRGMIKTIYSLAPGFDFFAVAMLESSGFPAQADRDRKGELVYTGFQATF